MKLTLEYKVESGHETTPFECVEGGKDALYEGHQCMIAYIQE